nr:reverse transcriptase domain-containing protein [Tanacetum cinerariifolium]
MHIRASNSELVEPLPEPECTLNQRLRRQNRRVPFDQRNNPPQHPRIIYPSILNINYFCYFLDILRNYDPMDDEPMWSANHVVALAPGSAITIPETTNEFAIKADEMITIETTTADKPYDIQKQFNDFMKSQESTNAFVKETFMNLKTQLETVAKNHQASIQNLKTKFDRLADKQSGRPFGSLPSNIQPNPRGSKAYQPPQACNEHVNAIFTRSGKSYDPPDNPNDQQDNFKNPINFDSDDEDDEPTSQPKTQPTKPVKETPLPKPYKPKIPYPQRLRKEKMEAQYRKFLDMIRAKQLNLGVGTERMIFNINSTMKHSYSNDDKCFSIDVIDEILEEYFDALLDEGSKILHSIEGTLLEEEIFSEFDEFMEMTADENSESESDTEEPPFEKIAINTDYKIKTSLEEPHTDLELKPLPDNLEYVFLEEPSFLPVIISSKLSTQYKRKLIFVLKKHKNLLLGKRQTFLVSVHHSANIRYNFWMTRNQLSKNKEVLSTVYQRKAVLQLSPTKMMNWSQQEQSRGGERMPFGLRNAPATFQRCMLAIFHDMIEESIEVFMDDFSVFKDSFDKCLNNLDKMFQRCKDAHFVLNWENVTSWSNKELCP